MLRCYSLRNAWTIPRITSSALKGRFFFCSLFCSVFFAHRSLQSRKGSLYHYQQSPSHKPSLAKVFDKCWRFGGKNVFIILYPLMFLIFRPSNHASSASILPTSRLSHATHRPAFPAALANCLASGARRYENLSGNNSISL